MKQFDWQDMALRVLIFIAGSVAAVLFTLKGNVQALPALATGSVIGVLCMGHFGPSSE